MIDKDISTILPNATGIGTGTAHAAHQTGDRVTAKLIDANIPGYLAEFDPDEAEAAGAFEEDALSEADAIASTHDAMNEADFAQALRVHTLFRRN